MCYTTLHKWFLVSINKHLRTADSRNTDQCQPKLYKDESCVDADGMKARTSAATATMSISVVTINMAPREPGRPVGMLLQEWQVRLSQ